MPGIEKAPNRGGFRRRQSKSYTRRFVAIVWIGLALFAGALRAESLYVVSQFDHTVSAYRIGNNGALALVPGSTSQTGSAPLSVAVDLFGRFVYVVNGDNTVSAYRIAGNGALTPVRGSPFQTGKGARSVAVDTFGRTVYVTNFLDKFHSGTVSAYHIGTGGILTPVVGSPFQAGASPFSVAVDLLGRFVYVANAVSLNISAYRIVNNGSLTPVVGSPFSAADPVCVTVARFGRFIYAESEDGGISAYSTSGNGILTPISGSSISGNESGIAITVDPLGRFAYVINANSFVGFVFAYDIGPDGGLTSVRGSPFSTGFFSGGTLSNTIVVDLLSRFVYVANYDHNNISAYSIGEDGVLTPLSESPFAVGTLPIAIAVAP
jgi:6-phosphogluconolactonase